MSVKSLSIVALAALGLCTGAAHAIELTTNGDFETGNLDGWTLFVGSGSITVASPGYLSSFAGNLKTGTSLPDDEVMKQANMAPGLAAGSPVTISFWAKGSTSAPGAVAFAEFFSEKAAGGTNKAEILGGGPLPITADWSQFTFNTTVATAAQGGAPGGVTLQLKAGCGGVPNCTADVYFDNASVTAVPEPSTYALLLAGLAGVGFVARRRG